MKLLSRLQDLKYLSCINTKQSFHLGESCVCAPAVAEHIAMVLSVQVSSIHLHPKRDFIILFLNTRAGSRDKKGAGVVKSVAEELRLFFYQTRLIRANVVDYHRIMEIFNNKAANGSGQRKDFHPNNKNTRGADPQFELVSELKT